MLTEKELKFYISNTLTALKKDDLYLAIIYFIQFGEYLSKQFPNTKVEDIKKSLKSYSHLFDAFELPSLSLPAIIFEAKTTCYMDLAEGADANTITCLNSLTNGVNCFNTLLGSERCEAAYNNINVYSDVNTPKFDNACAFIKDDLIPNTPARKKLDEAISSIQHEIDEIPEESKESVDTDIPQRLKTNADQYFANPKKDHYKFHDLLHCAPKGAKSSIVDKIKAALTFIAKLIFIKDNHPSGVPHKAHEPPTFFHDQPSAEKTGHEAAVKTEHPTLNLSQ